MDCAARTVGAHVDSPAKGSAAVALSSVRREIPLLPFTADFVVVFMISPLFVSTKCALVRNPDRLPVRVFVKGVERFVPTESGLLEAPERCGHASAVEAVHPYDTGAQRA
ncbi:hypothetical protein D3C87_1322120 [compost metagenome]